jgi:hypothetical protein
VKDSFYEELGGVFDKLPKYHVKMLGIFTPKWEGKTFSHQQLGIRVYTELVMIIKFG